MFNIAVNFTTINNLATWSVDKFCKSLNVEVINNFTLRVWTFRLLSPKSLNCFNHHFNKSFYNFFLYEKIIWSNTSLTRIWKFSPTNFINCMAQISSVMNDCRTFATEFQNASCKILCSDTSNNLTYKCWACKAN